MEQHDFVQESAPGGLAVLDKLENRLKGAIEQFRRACQRQMDAERDATEAKIQLTQKEDEIQRLMREVEELSSERDQVRQRIETLLGRVEALGA